MLNDDENAALGLGRSASQNIIVLTWPRKLWRTRTVPYLVSGHSYSDVRKFRVVLFLLNFFWWV